MRQVLTAALSYCAAVFVSVYLLPGAAAFALCAGLFVLFAASLIFLRSRRSLCLVLLFCAIGLLWSALYGRLFVAPADGLGGREAIISARVTDFPKEYDGYSAVLVRLTEPGDPGISALLYSQGEYFTQRLEPGDEISLYVRFAEPIKAKTLGTDKYSARGIFLRAYQRGELSKTGRYALSFIYFPKYLGRYVREAVLSAFPRDVFPLETALLTGDTGGLYADRELYGAMGIAGIMHVVAVSGMHVSFLTGMIGTLTGRRRRLTAAVAIPLIVIFIPMAGGGAAVIRAGFMQICVLLAPLIRREADSLTSLFAVLMMQLLINPCAAAGVSLQLSFGAMAGIILITDRISQRLTPAVPPENGALRWLQRTAVASLSCTAGASLFTLPLMALYFGYVSAVSPVTNLLTLTIVSLCFSLGYLICIVYYIFAPLGMALGWLLSWPLRYIELVVKLLAKLPYAALFTGNRFFAWWLVLAYGIFIVCYLGGGRRRFRAVLPLALCLITLCGAIFLSEMRMNSVSGYLTAVDVGRGEAIILTSGRSTAVIDCGGVSGGSRQVIDWLYSNGRRRINLIALTRLSADCASGTAELIERLSVDTLCLPGDAKDDDGLLPGILAAAESHGVAVLYIFEDTSFDNGASLHINALVPSLNNISGASALVFDVTVGDFEALIMGDSGFAAETALLDSGRLLGGCDVLVAGGHGAGKATSAAFLAATKPDTAIISVSGADSDFLPSEETLRRISDAGALIFRTDINGNIEIRIK